MSACLVALISSAGHPAWSQAADELIDRYDISIDIQRNGSIVVVERIDYDFGSQPHHGIFRRIPIRFHYDDRADRVYPVDVLSVVGSPGTPDQYEVNESGNQLQIKIGDPDLTITGGHTYTITYRVQGALNGFLRSDELYWNAIGTEWGVPIQSAAVAVRGPATFERISCFAGPPGSNSPPGCSWRSGSSQAGTS